jgi:hypothetical protein
MWRVVVLGLQMVDIKKSFGRAKDHMIQRSRVRIQEQRLEQVRVERERKPGWFKPPLMRPGDAITVEYLTVLSLGVP